MSSGSFTICFLPSVKLQGKERVGARVRRRYERPRTLGRRSMARPSSFAMW
jgi:hypothetical protein